jgi:CheY-like chemotaxis protein
MPNGLDILVAEDDPCIAAMLSDVLSDLGYCVVRIVDTAEDAIGFAAEGHVDLVVADVWLADGSNGLTAVRQLADLYGIPAIVCSGHALAEEAQAAGAVAFLEKPFRITDLERALDRAVAAIGVPARTPTYPPGTQAPAVLA